MSDEWTARRDKQAVLLGWGFAASVLLVLLSTFLSIWQMSRGKEELMLLFRESERSTYLIGHIGQQLSRMRLLLREEVARVSVEGEAIENSLHVLDATLRSSLAELEPLLTSSEVELWEDLEPAILRVRADLAAAAEALEREETRHARALLVHLVPDASRLMDGLASLNRLNREGTEVALRQADDRFSVMRVAEVTISFLLVIGIAASWWVVMRLVRRQREQIDEYVQRIESANADLNAFAGRTAHDLRNVLSPLLLAVGALKTARGDAARVANVGDRIERMMARGLALLDALLTFSRAGEVSGSHEVCSVRAELLAVVEELASTTQRAGAHVEIVIEPSTDPKVGCSAGLLGIILRNLIGNALKFAGAAADRRVGVTVRTTKHRCCNITVEDSGPGIPSEAIPHIFEPFYRAPGASAPGTGIGLATVQRIVQAHAGRIVVHSKLGEGARFEVQLPLAQSASSDPNPHAHRPHLQQ